MSRGGCPAFVRFHIKNFSLYLNFTKKSLKNCVFAVVCMVSNALFFKMPLPEKSSGICATLRLLFMEFLVRLDSLIDDDRIVMRST